MLKLQNISKAFNTVAVLHDINLDIKKGEIVSLLGESGSGKSTILNIIAGFDEADKGKCEYNEKIIFGNNIFVEPQDRHIGFVFQNYALFPHLNVEKNIVFGIEEKSKKFKKQTVESLLGLINMSGFEKKYPHQLSGGQQQRIAIARVLARNSELILFDEVFSSIDATLKFKLITEIKEIIKSQNKTAIFVTHSPKEAILISDKIAYIEDGIIVQYDSPDFMKSNPKNNNVANLFKEHLTGDINEK